MVGGGYANLCTIPPEFWENWWIVEGEFGGGVRKGQEFSGLENVMKREGTWRTNGWLLRRSGRYIVTTGRDWIARLPGNRGTRKDKLKEKVNRNELNSSPCC